MDLAQIRIAGIEYAAATERVNVALSTLKKELMAMREQDVQLLKQLIQISETIRRLSRPPAFVRRVRTYQRPLSTSVSMTPIVDWGDEGENDVTSAPPTVLRHPPLIRQQSEPRFRWTREMRWSVVSSTSSIEDFAESQEDGLFSSSSELDDSTSSLKTLQRRLRPRSFSFMPPTSLATGDLEGSEASYAEILRRNVQLWKCGLSHQDSVFKDDTFVASEEGSAER